MTTVDVDEVRHIVKRILATYPIEESWPSNIIDRVFKGIEDFRCRQAIIQTSHRQK